MLSHIYITIKLTSGYGGSPFCRGDFQKFADFCFKTYGDRVKNWFTINEPRMMAAHGYSDGFFAPVRCTGCKNGGNSATEPYIAGHHLLLSHAAAVTTYREKYQASRHWLTAPSSSSVFAMLIPACFPRLIRRGRSESSSTSCGTRRSPIASRTDTLRTEQGCSPLDGDKHLTQSTSHKKI
jgi:hypothetical protein